jgi:hypothetical protein
MAERSAEDIAAGVLRIAVGGSVREVPTLKLRWISGWAALFDAGEAEPKALGEWTMHDTTVFGADTVKQMLDLVVAYDRTGALGGREWLEENADPGQLRAALNQMVENAFPLADAAALVDLTITRAAAASIRPSSSSGASRTGTRGRTRSARSTTPSS